MIVQKHYAQVSRALSRLEVDIMPELYAADPKPRQEFDPHAPTAVILVSGFNGLGLSTVVSLMKLFGDQFRNVVFVSVGEVDSALFKSHRELETLERSLADDLQEYAQFASNLGFHSEVRLGLGTDVVLELGARGESRCWTDRQHRLVAVQCGAWRWGLGGVSKGRCGWRRRSCQSHRHILSIRG